MPDPLNAPASVDLSGKAAWRIHMLHLSCRELSCRGPDSEEQRSLAGPGDRVQSGPPATAGFNHSLLPKEAPVAQGANALTMASVTVRPLLDTERTLEPPLDHSVKGRGDNGTQNAEIIA
ncbi:unnamed protein product [Arctogadus glacialis]